MKIFPYILARIGGLSFEQVSCLSWSKQEELDRHLTYLNELEQQRSILLEDLLNLIQQIEDYPTKFYLKIIRRDLYNHRTFKVRPFAYEGTFKEHFLNLNERLKAFKTELKKEKEAAIAFERFYKLEVLESRKWLKTIKFTSLMKGLQLASHSLLDRLKSYQAKSIETVNKKTLQTERTLLQYLSRIATKTSPFSSFTALGIIDFDQKVDSSLLRKIRLNNSLFSMFRDTLIHYPTFFQGLGIRLNSSVQSERGDWVFLLNTRNIESVQRIESTPLVEHIIFALNEAEGAITFNAFVDTLSQEIDASTADISVYLVQLINYGLIEWAWPFSGLDPEWHLKLQDLLSSYESDDFLQKVKNDLADLTILMQGFEEGGFNARRLAQEKAYALVQKSMETLLEVSGLRNLVQEASKDHLKTLFSTQFNLKIEQLFYEDVRKKSYANFSKKDVENIAEELELLTRSLEPFYYNARKEKLLAFYKANYTVDTKIGLLTFYEAYFKNPTQEDPTRLTAAIEKRKELSEALMKSGTWVDAHQFHLKLEDLPQSNNENNLSYISKGSLIQLFKNEETIQAFTDAVFMGHGKMYGRFLHLFPAEITRALKSNNIKLQEGQRWVEAVDASVYNPNVHPALLAYELQMPGSQNNLPKEQQVSIRDLDICLDEKSDRLFLTHIETEEEVKIFNYGFEALDNRSPMYRMLACFNDQLVGPELLLDILREPLKQVAENGIERRPRIQIGKHLVIQRRTWIIPKLELPLKNNAESDAAYFIRIHQWRLALDLPEKIFLVINAPEFSTTQQRKGDDYKPQYIDFSAPLFVQLFAKLIGRVSVVLKIEEMFPELGGNPIDRVEEYLLEWEG